MLRNTVAGLARFCARSPRLVLLIGLCAAGASIYYCAANFRVSADTGRPVSPDLQWRQNQAAVAKEFPGLFDTTLIAVNAPTPELASAATRELAQRLRTEPDFFRAVETPGSGQFFARTRWLYRSTADLDHLTGRLAKAAPVISALADDPSLRGLTNALSLTLVGVQNHKIKLDDLALPLGMVSDTLDDALAGRPAFFSWQEMLNGKPSSPRGLRHFISVRPVLDSAALEPGSAAGRAVSKAAADLALKSGYGARVRVTGAVPLRDQRALAAAHGMLIGAAGAVLAVIIIVLLGFWSVRITAAVLIHLVLASAIAAALALLVAGVWNTVSAVFPVLFVAFGSAFAIPYVTRYRAALAGQPSPTDALAYAAQHIAGPLLAALAVAAAAFLCFLPTDYRGAATLGEIGTIGLAIAYVSTITLLPALLSVLDRPRKPDPAGPAAFGGAATFLRRYRLPIVAGAAIAVLVASPLLSRLRYDFDPIHLQPSTLDSVRAFLDLRGDPNASLDNVDLVLPTLPKADAGAQSIRGLPQVADVRTLSNFVPSSQTKKLALIHGLDLKIGTMLTRKPRPKPSDDDNVAALHASAVQLGLLAHNTKDQDGAGVKAIQRLARLLQELAKGDQAHRERAQAAFVAPLHIDFDRLRDALRAEKVTEDTLPPALKERWLTPNGKARVAVAPKDDLTRHDFARTLSAAYPDAVGAPITSLKAGDTVVRATIEATLFAELAIAVIVFLVTRRLGEIVLTTAPLLLAGLLVLEIVALSGISLNIINILAFPLIVGVAAAFSIYAVAIPKAADTDMPPADTRAIGLSVLTAAASFGVLALSPQPGLASLGALLLLSLACALAFTLLIRAAFAGKP